jgi:hypothetical protein
MAGRHRTVEDGAGVENCTQESVMATVSTTRGRRREAQRNVPPPTDDVETPIKPETRATLNFAASEKRHALICEAAYFRAERRGFCPGQELDDWLAAESEIDRNSGTGAGS